MLILTIITPLLGVAVVASVLGNFMQFGFMFTTKPLQPELKKINPIEGAKNLISKKKLVQMLLRKQQLYAPLPLRFLDAERSEPWLSASAQYLHKCRSHHHLFD